MSYMFNECNTLTYFPDIIDNKFSELNKNIESYGNKEEKSSEQNNLDYSNESEENNFYNKSNISSIKNNQLSKINFSNESINIENNLGFLNTSKVTKMNNMFAGCISLISLPDITNLDTSNVT